MKVKGFDKLMQLALESVKKKLTDEIDVHLLTDIKRMVDNGTLTLVEEDIEVEPLKDNLTTKKKQRIIFSGEGTIQAQQEMIEELAEKVNRLEERIMIQDN